MPNAVFSINMEAVTSTVVAAVILTVLAAIGRFVMSWATRLKQKLAAQRHKNVPMKVRTWTKHLVVMACLLWMLQATIRLSTAPLDAWSVALISGWTWAVLTYLLHIVRER